MKNKIKNFFNNIWVRRYLKALEKAILTVLFIFSACSPLYFALEYNNGWLILIGIITGPLAYLCGYRIFEEIL